MRQSGDAVLVAEKRYGKGSSREHSPVAEKLAGIRLVVAASFERIYRQNADNIGLLPSTDLGLVARLSAGAPIMLDELLHDRDALAASILREGGLLPFGQRHMRGVQDAGPATDVPVAAGPRTLFEKILARHWLPTTVTPGAPRTGQGGFVRADWRFIHEYYTGKCAHMLQTTLDQPVVLHQPQSIVVFDDHTRDPHHRAVAVRPQPQSIVVFDDLTSYVEQSPAHLRSGLVPQMAAMCRAQRAFVAQYGLRQHRTLTEAEVAHGDGSNVAGISHAMMAEHYALPGQLVAGTDSHTPHSGAPGCVAFGVGTTAMANAFVTGAVRNTVPEVLRVDLCGRLPPGLPAKDLVLHLLAQPGIRAGAGWARCSNSPARSCEPCRSTSAPHSPT